MQKNEFIFPTKGSAIFVILHLKDIFAIMIDIRLKTIEY